VAVGLVLILVPAVEHVGHDLGAESGKERVEDWHEPLDIVPAVGGSEVVDAVKTAEAAAELEVTSTRRVKMVMTRVGFIE